MTEQERKAAMALAEAQRHYQAHPSDGAKAMVEVARDALIAASYQAMQGQGAA
jgi:hypothetical protein